MPGVIVLSVIPQTPQSLHSIFRSWIESHQRQLGICVMTVLWSAPRIERLNE
jgi:hypothetical protein